MLNNLFRQIAKQLPKFHPYLGSTGHVIMRRGRIEVHSGRESHELMIKLDDRKYYSQRIPEEYRKVIVDYLKENRTALRDQALDAMTVDIQYIG